MQNTPMHRKNVIIECRELTCGNTCMMDYDDWHPEEWTCPRCELALHDQQLEAWANGERAKVEQREALRILPTDSEN